MSFYLDPEGALWSEQSATKIFCPPPPGVLEALTPEGAKLFRRALRAKNLPPLG